MVETSGGWTTKADIQVDEIYERLANGQALRYQSCEIRGSLDVGRVIAPAASKDGRLVFAADVAFVDCLFTEDVRFDFVVFARGCAFGESRFAGRASFQETTFAQAAAFANCTFYGQDFRF